MLAALFVLCLVPGCGGSSDGGTTKAGGLTSPRKSGSTTRLGDVAPSAADLAQGRKSTGTFTIRMEVWNYCGTQGQSLSLARTATRTESFSFATGSPTDDGQGGRENNPFSFSGGTDPDRGGSVDLSFFSALVLAVDKEGTRRLMHQYWNLNYQDGHLNAQMVDDGLALGGGANGLFDDDDLVPCQPQLGSISKYYPLADGATISADLTSSHMTLVLDGHSSDEARRVHIEATADAA